jgi:hypothetical protein
MRESACCSFSPRSLSMTSAARTARGHWTTDAHTDTLARVCPASAPSKDDVGPDDAVQPGLLSASWAAPKNLRFLCFWKVTKQCTKKNESVYYFPVYTTRRKLR